MHANGLFLLHIGYQAHCGLKQGRPELPIGPISVDLDTFDPIITIQFVKK